MIWPDATHVILHIRVDCHSNTRLTPCPTITLNGQHQSRTSSEQQQQQQQYRAGFSDCKGQNGANVWYKLHARVAVDGQTVAYRHSSSRRKGAASVLDMFSWSLHVQRDWLHGIRRMIISDVHWRYAILGRIKSSITSVGSGLVWTMNEQIVVVLLSIQ